MKHIAGFSARRVAKSDTWEAGYLYDTGKELKTNTGGTFITSERKFQRLKIFGTMDAALKYCREQEELQTWAKVLKVAAVTKSNTTLTKKV